MSPAVINNDDAVRRLLDEAGLEPTAPLEASLLELRAAGAVAPMGGPSAELLAFMAPAGATPAAPADPASNVIPFRRRKTVRGAVLGLAVAAATGLGVTGVAAASPEFRAAAGTAVEQVAGFFDPQDVQQSVPAAEPGADGSVPAGGTATGTAEGKAGTGGAASSGIAAKEDAGDAATPADDAGRSASQPASGNGSDPARVPGRAADTGKDAGSVPSEAEEAAKKLLEDARGTQPSDVVPSLPAGDGLPGQQDKPGSGAEVPGLPGDTPAVPDR